MTFLRSTLIFWLLLSIVPACGGNETDGSNSPSTADDDGDDTTSDDDDAPSGTKDAGTVKRDASTGTSTPKDAGTTPSEPKDSGTTPSTPKDAGTSEPKDAGKPAVVDAGNADAGGGLMLPDLGTLFPTNDAGATPPKSDAGTGGMGAPGAKDGPCKDLMLFCFDPFDMFLFNPELCFSCNGGKGCQGCAIPYAY